MITTKTQYLKQSVYTFEKEFKVLDPDKEIFVDETKNHTDSQKIKIDLHLNWDEQRFFLDMTDAFDVKHGLLQLKGGTEIGNLLNNAEALRDFFHWMVWIHEQALEIWRLHDVRKEAYPMYYNPANRKTAVKFADYLDDVVYKNKGYGIHNISDADFEKHYDNFLVWVVDRQKPTKKSMKIKKIEGKFALRDPLHLQETEKSDSDPIEFEAGEVLVCPADGGPVIFVVGMELEYDVTDSTMVWCKPKMNSTYLQLGSMPDMSFARVNCRRPTPFQMQHWTWLLHSSPHSPVGDF